MTRAAAPESATLQIKVVPRTPHNRIDGWLGETLKVRLQAPPVEGKANNALIALLADVLNIGKGQVEILSGETARLKRVRIHGLSAEQVKARVGKSEGVKREP